MPKLVDTQLGIDLGGEGALGTRLTRLGNTGVGQMAGK